jgi:hypothetical protein
VRKAIVVVIVGGEDDGDVRRMTARIDGKRTMCDVLPSCLSGSKNVILKYSVRLFHWAL